MYWFTYLSHLNDATGAEPPPAEHAAIELLFAQAEARVDRAFLGQRWLRRRFGSDRTVEVRCTTHDAATVEVARVLTVGGSRKRVVAEARLPSDWFAGRIDGLLGLRLMATATRSLRAIGDELGLGTCPLRTSDPDRGRVAEIEPFGPRRADPLDAVVAGLLDRAPRDALLVVAGSNDPADRPWQDEVVRRLRATRHDDERPSVWRAPLPG
jgi:hypothetical protein